MKPEANQNKQIEIRDRNGKTVFTHSCEKNSFAKTLTLAVASGIDLRNLNFDGENISSVDLSGKDLRETSFAETTVYETDFRGSHLTGSLVVKTNLPASIIVGAYIDDLVVPTDEACAQRVMEVAKMVCDNPDVLSMSHWHSGCGTTHCIAGLACVLAGEDGLLLENRIGCQNAGLILLGPEAASHFYDETIEALDWLEVKMSPE